MESLRPKTLKFLLIAVCPYDEVEEVWIPYWLEATSFETAQVEAKRIAFHLYRASTQQLDRFRFKLFRMDFPLPTDHQDRWLSEFRKQPPT